MSSMHQRLLGRWKSDRRKTVASFPDYREMTLTRKRKLGRIFGHLEIEYTPKYFATDFQGFERKDRYEIVAEDDNSLVLREMKQNLLKDVDPFMLDIFDATLPVFLKPQLRHLHFETVRGQDYYWFTERAMGLGSFYAEWFKRVA